MSAPSTSAVPQLQSDLDISTRHIRGIRLDLTEAEYCVAKLKDETKETLRAWESAAERLRRWRNTQEWQSAQAEAGAEQGDDSHWSRTRPQTPPKWSWGNPKPSPNDGGATAGSSRPHTDSHHRSKPQEDPEDERQYQPPPLRRGSPHYKPPKPSQNHKRKPTHFELLQYLDFLHNALRDHSRIKEFPTPPAWPCNDKSCVMTKSQRTLAACKCNLRDIFEDSSAKQLRNKLHPDRFSSVAPERREAVQKAAQEVFVVVDELYREQM